MIILSKMTRPKAMTIDGSTARSSALKKEKKELIKPVWKGVFLPSIKN